MQLPLGNRQKNLLVLLLRNLYLNVLAKNLKERLLPFFGKSPLPFKYNFICTNKCNSRCKTCNVWKLYSEGKNNSSREISPNEFLRAIDSVKNNVVWLNLTGGEPLLRQDLKEIVCGCYDLCKNLSLINIPSNGLMPEKEASVFEEVAAHCSGAEVFVTLSIDGLGKKHDFVRGVNGAFEKLLESHACLKKVSERHKNFHVSFQLTVSKFNIDNALEVFDFIQKNSENPIVNFAHELAIFHNENSGIGVQNYPEETVKVIGEIEKRYKLANAKSLMPLAYLRHMKKFLLEKKKPVCKSGLSTVTIDPFGNVLPCPYWQKILGNLPEYDYDLKRLLDEKRTKKLLDSVEACNLCWQSCEAYPALLFDPLKIIF